MKRCCTCKADRPIDDFGFNKSSSDGRMNRCRACCAAKGKEYKQRVAAAPKVCVSHKPCRRCGADRDINDFGHDKTHRDGHAAYCFDCSYVMQRESRQRIVMSEKQIPKTKICCRCHREKSSDDFQRDRTHTCGLHGYCKQCHGARETTLVRRAHAAKRMREYRKQNNVPFTHRWWVLRLLSTHSRLTVPDVRKIEQRFVRRPCCEYCSVNLSTTPEKLQFDHRIPKSRGGEYSEANTAITCDACNRLKLDMTDTEFRAFLLEYISRFDAPIQATVHSLADYAKKEPSL